MGLDTITVEVNTSFIDPGATATDNYCILTTMFKGTGTVDLTKLGTYVITYVITDCQGNVADSVKRFVKVVDTEAPVIKLHGKAIGWIYTVHIGTYIEQGYDAPTDNYTPVAKLKIDTIAGDPVNIDSVGVYHIQYSATDESGNVGYTAVRYVTVLPVSGIQSYGDLEGTLSVYPNPASTNVTISVDLKTTDNVCLSMYDMFGKEVINIHCGQISKSSFNVDLSSYNKGVYFIKLQSKDKQLLQKLIIN
jgi:hypothetical protein